VAAAFLCFVYLPFVPVLAAATAAGIAGELVAHRSARPELAKRVALAAFVLLILVGFDVRSIIQGLLVLLDSKAVGAHVPLAPLGMAAIALGPVPVTAPGVPRDLAPGAAPLVSAAALLAAVGAYARRRDRRARGLLAALGVLAGLAAWNAFFARDPWTSARGHSWNLFKAAQWAFPLLLLAQAAGLAWLRRRARGIEVVFVAGAFALTPAHVPWSIELGRGLTGIVDGERPLRAVDGIVRGFRALPTGRLLLIGLPGAASAFRGGYAALLAWPRTLTGDWEASAYTPLDPEYESLVARIGDPEIVPVLADAPPFDAAGREDLGGGFARLVTLDRPRLVQVVGAMRTSSRRSPWREVVSLMPPRTKLLLLNPGHEATEVVLEVELPPGSETTLVGWQVVRGSLAGFGFHRAVRDAPLQRLDLRRRAPARISVRGGQGLTTLVLVPEARALRLVGLGLYSAAPPTRSECGTSTRPTEP
jgi:hypothetical protein